jgi:hypothetical protein
MNSRNVDPRKPVMANQGPMQENGLPFGQRLALAFVRMDELLKDPQLTPEQRYAIAAPLLIWIE